MQQRRAVEHTLEVGEAELKKGWEEKCGYLMDCKVLIGQYLTNYSESYCRLLFLRNRSSLASFEWAAMRDVSRI
ncbi:protein of unknown function [Nitrospira japonica]|uniref:Uncharacterized protein n=1 Tax=Nitrospira japonica TaxID=1325564 RepID=A0A1W1IAW3_9BACT|nr:protein of unknown function [Nitrospira japonica]